MTQHSGSETSNISIYLRIRPIPSPYRKVAVDTEEGVVDFHLPKDALQGYINNSREKYEFKFDGIFPGDAKQDEVFTRSAHKVVTAALDGFNGTVFAYGQTGSGKTFTITGGAERYVDRGIIPRAISHIFSELATRSEWTYNVHISYLELYNEQGYDLLNPDHDTRALEDLPKVHLMEDEDGRIHLRNLSAHLATTEEEALNLLFLGDTNRMISATPMNQVSSRSHCVFTVNIEARRAGSDLVRRSKLHLVDLAGSERVSKTGVDGQILKEAKYINLSLHFLEQVIIALQERSQGKPRVHVPYRNSMMTSVLRDSLGGNCKTVMIATINIAQDQLEESISTCRFAQRVAMISNQVMVNEATDPVQVIRRLKDELKEAKVELKLLRGDEEERGPLTESERDNLRKDILQYIEDTSSEAKLNVGASMMFIRSAFEIFRSLLLEANAGRRSTEASSTTGSQSAPAGEGVTPDETPSDIARENLSETVRNLKLQVAQRDNEINILVSMVGNKDQPGSDSSTQTGSSGAESASSSTVATLSTTGTTWGARGLSQSSALSPAASTSTSWSVSRSMDSNLYCEEARSSATSSSSNMMDEERRENSKAAEASGRPDETARGRRTNDGIDITLLADRNKAFEMFRKSYRKNQYIEENKAVLKAKYSEAKGVGEKVNAARERINSLKSQIEQRRLQRAAVSVAEGVDPSSVLAEMDPEEDTLKAQVDKEKALYKDNFNKLRELKREIEHVQMLLNQSRVRLQHDFEQWLKIMARQHQPERPLKHEHPTDVAQRAAGMEPQSKKGERTPIKPSERPASPLSDSNANLTIQTTPRGSGKRLVVGAQTNVGQPNSTTPSRPRSASLRPAQSVPQPGTTEDTRVGYQAPEARKGGVAHSASRIRRIEDGADALRAFTSSEASSDASSHVDPSSHEGAPFQPRVAWNPASSPGVSRHAPIAQADLSADPGSARGRKTNPHVGRVPRSREHLDNQDVTRTPSGRWAEKSGQMALTGNAGADADIVAFYKAREKLMRASLDNSEQRLW